MPGTAHERNQPGDDERARAAPDACSTPWTARIDSGSASPWNEWYGNVPDRREVDRERGERPDAHRELLPRRRRQPVGERRRDGERSERQRDRPPGPAPLRHRAGGVGLARELPGGVVAARAAGSRARAGSPRREPRGPPTPAACRCAASAAPRRPRTISASVAPCHGCSHRRSARPPRRRRWRPRSWASSTSGIREDRDRGHQVAPQVLPGPHLARDEVERVLARVAAPVRPRDEPRRRHDREQREQQRRVPLPPGGSRRRT